ncbi:MAG TPA: vitamin K epoxide reductase family protein [Gemmatimonadaceae bacterium]
MALISLLGLFIGAYLTLYKFGFIGTLVCGVSSCEQVQTSRWSVFLGLPVATWGLGFYALMLILAIVGMQERYAESRGLALTVLLLAAWGAIFTGWLNYLEAFVIHAWCEWCLFSAGMVLVMFMLAALDYRDVKTASADEI